MRVRDRELRRRRQRRAKVRYLKARLEAAKTAKEREKIIEKLKRVSYYPPKLD